jgi:short subunit dehydrogenase-like uncharacterized protein
MYCLAGYWSTSRMLLESGLALALDNDKINASGECRSAGVLTPATGMVGAAHVVLYAGNACT